VGGRGIVEDVCYKRRRAEACVDLSAHHALVNAGEREIVWKEGEGEEGEREREGGTREEPGVCVECLIGKQNKPTLFKVTEPSSVPYRTPPACATWAAYLDPPPVILVPESIAAVPPHLPPPLGFSSGWW